MPQGVTWSDASKLLPTAASLFLVILAQSAATSRAYAVKYGEPFDENTDLVGLGLANLAAGFSSTFVVNGSPTKTEMVDEAKSHTQVAQLTTAAVVAIVLLFLTKPLAVPAERACSSSVVFLIGVKLIDVRGMREILRLRKDEFVGRGHDGDRRRRDRRRAGDHPRDRALAASSTCAATTRPSTSCSRWDEQGHVRSLRAGGRARGASPDSSCIASAPASSTRTRNASPTRCSSSRAETTRRAGSSSTLRAIDDIDFTGGKTLGELAGELKRRGVVLAVADFRPSVRAELDRYGLTAQVGETRIFETAVPPPWTRSTPRATQDTVRRHRP